MANFWRSSQSTQFWTKESLQETHSKDRARGLTQQQLDKLYSFHIRYIGDLTRCGYPNGLRQRVGATACVFFRRFYLRNDFCEYDPRGVAPASLYLAAKVEETLLQARYLFQLMQRLAARYPSMLPTMEVRNLMDLEMALLEELDFKLVVWHPYSDLAAFLHDIQLGDIARNCWAVLNDSYRTDACLLYPPHVIALACLHVGAALTHADKRSAAHGKLEEKVRRWSEGISVDLDQVYSATQDLLHMYRPLQAGIALEEAAHLLGRLH